MRLLPHHFKHTWYAHRPVKSPFGTFDEFQARPPWLSAAYFKPIGGVLNDQGTMKRTNTWVLGADIGLGFSASATEGVLGTFDRHIPSTFAACRRWAQLSESPL